jgi:hypothetical protein
MKIIRARKFVAAAAAVAGVSLALSLTACSGLNAGALPGSAASGAVGAQGTGAQNTGAQNTRAQKAAGCTANGTSIPDGHYAGPIKATIKTTMSINTGGISIPNAGSGDEAWSGTINLISSGGKVTGTISLSEFGDSQVGTSGGVEVHSVDRGHLKGTVSGPASKPVVGATMSGDWASFDAPVINGKGAATSNGSAGLHVTSANCTSISGNAVAMFADLAAPVAQYIAISGSGTWVATRK